MKLSIEHCKIPNDAPQAISKRRTIVIMQPYFLPYRNYYGLIFKADYFVVFDDVQFTRKWQQRNQILCPTGKKEWLTIPVFSIRPALQLIKDAQIKNDEPWKKRMIAKMKRSYQGHPYFDDVYPELRSFLAQKTSRLCDFTVPLLWWSASKMGIPLPQSYLSSELGGRELGRTERLVYICRLLGARRYLVGPAARAYLDENLFEAEGIQVVWHEDSYPDYPQKHTLQFDHYVSALDLLMNCGSKSVHYLEPIESSHG